MDGWWWEGMGGGDLRPPSPVYVRAMRCSKARSSQIILAIRV